MLFFALTFHSIAQEKITMQPKDTSLSLVQLYPPEFIFEQSLNFTRLTVGTSEQFTNYTFQSAMPGQTPLVWEFQNNKIDIAAPWKLQYAHEKGMQKWNIIFSSLSTGGALYIAYRHVEKYGFW